MTPVHSDPMLRRVLWLDAATCFATGAALLVLGGVLEGWLDMPAVVSRSAGVFLLLFAAEVTWIARREVLPRKLVRAIIVANALWVLASIVALVAGWLTPNTLGTAFVIAQAVAVAVIAEMQVIGLRRLPAAAR